MGITLLRTGYSVRPEPRCPDPHDSASLRVSRRSTNSCLPRSVSVSNRYRAKETHNKADSRLYLRVIHENGTVHPGVGADVAAHARRTVAICPRSQLPVSSTCRRTDPRPPGLGLRRTRTGGPVMTNCVRAGVVGVGSVGRHHAHVYSELPRLTSSSLSRRCRRGPVATASSRGWKPRADSTAASSGLPSVLNGR